LSLFSHLPGLINFVLILGVMVLVHEFGHFLVAKLCGVRVEAFAFGFGKRLFGYRAKSGTDYRINLFPFGGYVKMTGEIEVDGIAHTDETASRDDAGNFNVKPRWQRILIALAGPIFNFILAFFILFAVNLFHHEVAEGLQGAAVVDYVVKGSAADAIGLQLGDTITRFDKVENPGWLDIFNHCMLHLNQPVAISYRHNGQTVDKQIVITSNGKLDDFDPIATGWIPRAQNTPLIVASVLPDSAMAEAGAQAGDRIATIDGFPLRSTEATSAYMTDQKGQPITLGILRNNAPLTLKATPRLTEVPKRGKVYRLGFSVNPPPARVEHMSFAGAARQSWDDNKKTSLLIVDMLHGMFTREVSVRNVSGPVGIFQQIDTASSISKWYVLMLAAGISVNLGIFNLLPFPILDGGMILFLLIESVMRRDLNPAWKERVYQAAFFVILLVFGLIIFNDVSKFAIFHHAR
jgi:regulator of sigma E protease